MDLSRRDVLKAAAATCLAAATANPTADAGPILRRTTTAGCAGPMTGAKALVETLLQEGVRCVFGIPGAQENELWDAMKTKHLPLPARHARVLRRRAWPTATPAAPASPASSASCPAPA